MPGGVLAVITPAAGSFSSFSFFSSYPAAAPADKGMSLQQLPIGGTVADGGQGAAARQCLGADAPDEGNVPSGRAGLFGSPRRPGGQGTPGAAAGISAAAPGASTRLPSTGGGQEMII